MFIPWFIVHYKNRSSHLNEQVKCINLLITFLHNINLFLFFYINIFDLFICMRDAEETLCIVGVMCIQRVTCPECDGYRSDEQEYWKKGCGLTEVPEDIPAQARVVMLDWNAISHIRDGAFRHLTVCEGLYLRNNTLTEVRTGMWEGLSSLTKLSLSFNQISTMGAFNTLTSLTSLSLSTNQISTIPVGAFNTLSSLTWLSLSRNQISTIPVGAFNTLTSLTKLYLYQNQISTIPVGAFNTLTSLTKLHLHQNQISTIPVGAFNTLTSLTSLSLSRNQISTIPVGAFNTLTSLTNLYLDNNQLVTLEEGLFNTPLRTSLALKVDHNPLHCDERMCWVKQAQRVGHITWDTWWSDDGRPQCKNQPYVHWYSITLNCEPGQSAHTNKNILIEPGQPSH